MSTKLAVRLVVDDKYLKAEPASRTVEVFFFLKIK